MNRTDIINAIDEYSAATNLKPTTICQYAIRNRNFYARLKAGLFREHTAEALLTWMRANPPQSRVSQ